MGSVEDFINNELERKDTETQALDGLEAGMQGEELLQRMLDSQQHYRALFQNSFDLVCLVDFSGRFLDVNPRMLSLLDYDREQMLSFNILSLLAEEQKEGMQKMLHGLRKGRTADSLQELRLIDRAGAYLNLECVTSIMSRENKPHAVMLIARDVT